MNIVGKVQNDGNWPPILAFLDQVQYRVEFLGVPRVSRNQDGTLNVQTCDGLDTWRMCQVGEWLYCIENNGVRGFKVDTEEPDVARTDPPEGIRDDSTTVELPPHAGPDPD